MFNNLFKKNSKSIDKDEQQVINLINDLLDDEYKGVVLTENTVLEDVGFDSIKYMQLLLSLEDVVKKDVEEIISTIDLFSIKTIKDILIFVSDIKSKK